ncbi:hypothetical protein BCR43DRAFT_564645, partial [Syncephalastrum racemosum]
MTQSTTPSSQPSIEQQKEQTVDNTDEVNNMLQSININGKDANEATKGASEQKTTTDQAGESDRHLTPPAEVDKRGNPAACIFVASLAKGKTDEELNVSVSRHFKRWGTLLNVKVLKDWMERPYAFVQFERAAEAKQALAKAPNTILDGRHIRCEPARVNRTLCLIPYSNKDLSKELIREKLSGFGKIEDITVLYPNSRKNGKTRHHGSREPCAFVKYCYRDDAIQAYLSLHGDRGTPGQDIWWPEWASNLGSTGGHHPTTPHYKRHRTRDAKDASHMDTRSKLDLAADHENEATDRPLPHPREPLYASASNTSSMTPGPYGPGYMYSDFPIDPCSIFVGNLSDSVTEKAIHQRFSMYGDIVDLHVVRKTTERSYKRRRVFAFVQYTHESSAAHAIECEDGAVWNSRALRLAFREHRGYFPFPAPVMYPPWYAERPHPPGMGMPAASYYYQCTTGTFKNGPGSGDSGSAAWDTMALMPPDSRPTTPDDTALPVKETANEHDSSSSNAETHGGASNNSSSDHHRRHFTTTMTTNNANASMCVALAGPTPAPGRQPFLPPLNKEAPAFYDYSTAVYVPLTSDESNMHLAMHGKQWQILVPNRLTCFLLLLLLPDMRPATMPYTSEPMYFPPSSYYDPYMPYYPPMSSAGSPNGKQPGIS